MKKFTFFAGLFFVALSVGKAGITIQLLGTFRYPAPKSGAITSQINDSDILVGYISGVNDAPEGFYAHPGGEFSAPFREPDDIGQLTIASGINNQQHLCGYYLDGIDSTTKGFVRIGEKYLSFVAPVQDSLRATLIYSINDADNFVGGYNSSSYSMINGVFTTLPIAAESSEATGINNLNQIVGRYTTEVGVNYHGYFLDIDGSSVSYDFPAAQRTEPSAINDADFIVGDWFDGFTSHGFLIQLPSTFISYDVPGTLATIISGVNNNGVICGTCWKEGKPRGFTAQIVTQ